MVRLLNSHAIPSFPMKPIANHLFFAWAETELSDGRSVRFRLKGVSMTPLIRDGRDEVIVYPCTPHELAPMDVVLFRYNDNHLLHRIIGRDGDNLLLQGDGSLVAQERCHVTDVVGKVHTIVRPTGREVSVENWRWRFLSRLWCNLGPFRRILLRILRIVERVERVEKV